MAMYKDVENFKIPEKRIRISIRPSQKDSQRVDIIIENNGKPFYGNIEKVFDCDKDVCEYISQHNCEVKYKVVMQDEKETANSILNGLQNLRQ